MIADSAETARLLEQVADGDQAAFDALFGRNREPLRRHIELRLDPKLRPRVDPSDVIQETHVVALHWLDDYLSRRPMPFHLWLQKTALERIAKLRRRHRTAACRSVDREIHLPDQTSLALAQQFCKTSQNPGNEAARRDLHQQVRQALARLPDIDREILIMRYVERRDNQEIAYVLDMKSDAVSRRHGRAVLKLAKLLRQSGIGESDL